MISWESEKNVR